MSTIELIDSEVLNQDLFELPFSSSLKSEIAKAIFGCNLTASNFDVNPRLLGGYFDFYSDQCLHSSHHICQIRSHGELIKLILLLKAPGETRQTIQEHLREQMSASKSSETDAMLGFTIDLAARLSLMTFVGRFPFDAGQRTLTWTETSLQDKIHEAFKVTETPVQRVKLEKFFTAKSIEQIGGMRIDWTSNLADHLRLHEDDTVVSIFHHASFLSLQQENPLLPEGFIEETLLTLSILFPPHDTISSAWFQNQPRSLHLDIAATRCKHLQTEDRQIEKFKYWHDRLGVLKQVFDEAEPKSIIQWWRDRRRPVQWYNFWLAIALIGGLTFFFGLVQSIEGGMQVWKAWHPS